MELQVLGPLAVVRDGQVVDHGGPKQAALLDALALHLGHVVPTDGLVDLRSELPLTSVLCAVLLRVGMADLAREVLASAQIGLEQDDWTALLTWCTACEVAAGLGLPELGAAAYARALPYAGRAAVAGSSGPIGPVDAYLALGAAAAGERGTARRHADDAELLCRTWQVPRVAQWLHEARDRHGFELQSGRSATRRASRPRVPRPRSQPSSPPAQ